MSQEVELPSGEAAVVNSSGRHRREMTQRRRAKGALLVAALTGVAALAGEYGHVVAEQTSSHFTDTNQRRLDIHNCVVAPDELTADQRSNYFIKAAQLLHIRISKAEDATYLAAACPTDTNPLVQTRGQSIESYEQYMTDISGVIYQHCVVFGVARQLDARLPQKVMPMLLVCEGPDKSFVEG